MIKNLADITDLVKQDLCTGCGVCISESPNDLKMQWNEFGFLTPHIIGDDLRNNSIRVCPFNPAPDEEVKDEDKLANIFLSTADNYDPKIGRFENTYVGYSNDFRQVSSSGGLATYIFQQLLKKRIVDHLFIVREVNGTYQYQFFSDVDNISQISKTRYLPVTLEDLFLKINDIEGTIAVSGVACFLKAIRLKQYYHPELKEKIKFLIGIICGGLKSKFFTDYLAQKAGIKSNYHKQEYRIKDAKSSAIDYSFGAFDDGNKFREVKMRSVGDMWGTGLFKSNACDFCDDVTTELADISLGDAWIHPYNQEGLGNSVIVTRSKIADTLIVDGIAQMQLSVKLLDVETFKRSQKGSFNHRQKGIKYRIQARKFEGLIVPLKRSRLMTNAPFEFKRVQKVRMDVRSYSLVSWQSNQDALAFESSMAKVKNKLYETTRFYHKVQSIKRVLGLKTL